MLAFFQMNTAIPVLAAIFLIGLAPLGFAQYQSPLDQLKSGTPISEIACREGKMLLEKNQKPYCVSADTAERLEQRGWGIVERVPVPEDGPSISIVTEKSNFKEGEEVRFKLVNTGTVPLYYTDTSYGLSIRDLSGPPSGAYMAGAQEVELWPGEEIEFVRNLSEGTYEISVKMYSKQGPAQSSTTITISK